MSFDSETNFLGPRAGSQNLTAVTTSHVAYRFAVAKTPLKLQNRRTLHQVFISTGFRAGAGLDQVELTEICP